MLSVETRMGCLFQRQEASAWGGERKGWPWHRDKRVRDLMPRINVEMGPDYLFNIQSFARGETLTECQDLK